MKKIIVITGGADGLGKELARLLTKDYTVIIIGRTAEKVQLTAKEIACLGYQCDVTCVQQLQDVFNVIERDHGKIYTLINNAGVRIEGPLAHNSYDQIHAVVMTNVAGYIYTTKTALPHMTMENCYIININSQAGLYGKGERSVYHASKRAITGFTKSLQDEYHGTGVKVVGAYPGKMNTGFFAKVGVDKKMGDHVEVHDVADMIVHVIHSGMHIPEIGFQSTGYT